jgi:hypothetical protein
MIQINKKTWTNPFQEGGIPFTETRIRASMTHKGKEFFEDYVLLSTSDVTEPQAIEFLKTKLRESVRSYNIHAAAHRTDQILSAN